MCFFKFKNSETNDIFNYIYLSQNKIPKNVGLIFALKLYVNQIMEEINATYVLTTT